MSKREHKGIYLAALSKNFNKFFSCSKSTVFSDFILRILSFGGLLLNLLSLLELQWAQVHPVSCPDLTALNNEMGPQDIRNGYNQIRNWANQNLFNISYFEPCLVFLSGKKIMLKNFVRNSKYTKMSVFSCILFWDINFENPLNRFKAAMFFLRPLKQKIFKLIDFF